MKFGHSQWQVKENNSEESEEMAKIVIDVHRNVINMEAAVQPSSSPVQPARAARGECEPCAASGAALP